MDIFQKSVSPRLIILLAFIAMLILSFISFTRIRRMNELATEVNHSHLIKLNLQELYSDLSDADSELSKHILTSDISYRNRMVEFETKSQILIQQLKSLTSGNFSQAKRVAALEGLIQKRFELMGEELNTTDKDYKKITSAITDCNHKIMKMINVMKESETAGLIEKEKSVADYKSWTPVMIFSLEILVTLFLIFGYYRIDKELTIKRSLQKELESQVHFKRAILDNSVDLILVLDASSNLLVSNRKSNEVLGLTQAMIGTHIFTLFPDAESSKSHDGILRALKGEYVHILKHSCPTKVNAKQVVFPCKSGRKMGCKIQG